jgi:REP element-mobilizing transposase RayT
MGRGLDRRVLFRDDPDRADLVHRLGAFAGAGALTVSAWALLPNHFHLLMRTGPRPLAQSLKRLLTGYVVNFNRRHTRAGHLFQNRYKSIVGEAEPYFLELVRYLHLNPLRAKIVSDLRTLDRYPWTGHSALLGRVFRSWQDTQTILAQFGATTARAAKSYRAFVAAGIPQGRRPELQGGGLVRSLGGWAAVTALRRGREAYRGDERVLGSPEFVATLQRAVDAVGPARAPRVALYPIITRVCRHLGLAPAALTGGGRWTALQRARAGIAYLWVEVLGHPGRPLAMALGVSPQAVYQAVARGRETRTEWERVLKR